MTEKENPPLNFDIFSSNILAFFVKSKQNINIAIWRENRKNQTLVSWDQNHERHFHEIFCLFFEKSTNNKTWEIKTKFSFLKRVHFRLKMATLITTIIWHPALSSWSKTKVCSMESSKKVKSIDVKLTNQKTIEALSILRWIRNKRRYCLSNHWF